MKNTTLIDDIIHNDVHCYFISPHLDDAVFSAGELMSRIANRVKVDVVNVFTNPGDGVSTLSARTFLNQCKSINAIRLFRDRIKEDQLALGSLGGVTVHNLDFTDGLWRKKRGLPKFVSGIGQHIPEIASLYPTYRWHIISGKIHADDMPLITEVRREIRNIVNPSENHLVFCPIGYGQHVDHLVVKKACTQEFSSLIYWADIPYYFRMTKHDSSKTAGYVKRLELVAASKKERLCKKYASQYDIVLGSHMILNTIETYYEYKRDAEMNSVLS